MGRFVLNRLLQLPLILGIIYLVTFMLVWVAPGDPLSDPDRPPDAATLKALQEEYHADSPWKFLAYYPWRLLTRGDFGPSMAYREWSVNEIIFDSLPVSVTLGVFAIVIAVLVGVAVGTLAAVKRGGLFDWFSLTIALAGISLPSFVVASVLLSIFAVNLRWFGVGSWGSLSDLVLPGVALSLLPMAYIARLTRVAMIDVLSSDYVRTARAKGLARWAVVWKHCLRNAFLPVLSYLGPAAAVTLTGSFVVEEVFNVPGLGQHFVNSVANRDRTLVLGVVMVYGFMVLLFNFLVDVAYAFVDPRIEVGARSA